MEVKIKSEAEIAKMRIAGRLTADVLEMITPYVKVGVTTEELDKRCYDFIVNVQKAIPAPLNYRGFPKSICTSINHQVCHGIPSAKILKDGDIINIDVSVIKDLYHGDSSMMFMVGKPSIKAERLIKATQECMYKGIQTVKPGAFLGDIGAAIETHAKQFNFSVVHEYCGHGIGLGFHEDPQILHYGKAGTGIIMEPGMIFTIEPMINAGKRHINHLPDGWTVVTKDHSLSAQWEHTILVTENGYEILTLRNDEQIPQF